jgi:hypothetical protein
LGILCKSLGQKEYKDNRDRLAMNYLGLKFIFEKSLLNSINSWMHNLAIVAARNKEARCTVLVIIDLCLVAFKAC